MLMHEQSSKLNLWRGHRLDSHINNSSLEIGPTYLYNCVSIDAITLLYILGFRRGANFSRKLQ